MARQAQVIESARQLLLIRFPEVVDGEAVRTMMDAYDRALRRGVRFVSVLDGTETRRLPDADARRILVGWMQDETRMEKERALSIGAATVVPSGLVRAFVAAIYFVRKPIAPQHWTPTLAEGLDWARARLVEAGAPVTPELERLRAEASAAEEPRARRAR